MTMAFLFATLSALSLLLFAYPYLIYPRILRRLRQVGVQPGPERHTVSLLFCAYNEAASLPEKLQNLRQLKIARPDLQILAYDDGSADETFELLSSQPDLVTAIRGPGRNGKVAGMRRLVTEASGDVLVFTDANVIFAPDAIEQMLPYYADPAVGGVCGTLRYLEATASATAEVGSLYWNMDERLRSLESATGNVMGADGSIFSVRRELYPQLPDTVQDDLAVSMNVIFEGKRLIKAPGALAYERSVSRRGEELQRKVRIGAGAYHTHRFLRAGLRRMSPRDRFKYISRKMIRWFGGVFLAAAALFGFLAVALLSTAAASAAVIGVVLAGVVSLRSNAGYLAKVGEVVLATYATLWGILQAIRGKTVATWVPAKSR